MLTSLIGLLAIGTFWFYMFAIAVFIVITCLVESDEGVWATIVFIGTICSLQFLSNVPILDYLKSNPGHTLLYVGLYFLIGTGWTLIKWYFFVHRQLVKYNVSKRKWMKDNNVETLTPELAAKFFDYISHYSVSAKAPDPSDHKADFTRWGTYWVFSMVGTALNDVVRRAWEYVYEMLQTTYQRMSKAMFKGADADAELAKSYTPPPNSETPRRNRC